MIIQTAAKLGDIRSVCKKGTNIRNSLTDKHKQLLTFINDWGVKASSLCLYYPTKEWYDLGKIESGIMQYQRICKGKEEGQLIKKLLIVVDGIDEFIIRDI